MSDFSTPSEAQSETSSTQGSDPMQSPQPNVAQGTPPPKPDKPEKVEYRFCSLRLPLAVYREVAAHLRQIDGVDTGLLPQTSKEFDYLQSQVGGLWVRYAPNDAESCQPQIEAILAYYGDRYGQWETLSTKV